MYHVGILYAPYDNLYKSIIDIICSSIDSSKYDIRVKKAADAAMPDIAASEIIIFASSGSDKTPVHEDFKEIIRALKGINLSGRLAGIVEFNKDKSRYFLEDILQNTGAACYEDILNIGKGKVEKHKIENWIKSLLQKYEGAIYDREKNGKF